MAAPPPTSSGPLAWMAGNPVAANVLMACLLLGGAVIVATGGVRQEVYPDAQLDVIRVTAGYPGASPKEVEQAVLLALEEAVRSVDGLRNMESTAREGWCELTVELLRGTDVDRALSDVKAAIDRISSFPEDVERPIIALDGRRAETISLIIYGDVGERALYDATEEARSALLADDRITDVEVLGSRRPEISIELSAEALRRYGLTQEQVAARLRGISQEVPAGEIDGDGGQVLLRVAARRRTGVDWGNVPLVTTPEGTSVRLGDVANVVDGFTETWARGRYEGEAAMMIDVFRVGDQTPLEVAAAAREVAETYPWPAGIRAATMDDQSEIYWDRVELLRRNALYGLVLVLLTLGLFLEPKLAFWVTLGIPISFLGSLMVLPALDASINMISLFAFIVSLGIVVDDAIVVGEAVHRERERGGDGVAAAIRGARSVAVPVVFGVVTTMIAFAPILFVPGSEGKLFGVIPVVVITVLALSLVEALLILPAHLAQEKPSGPPRGLGRVSAVVGGALRRFVEGPFDRFLRRAMRQRVLAMAVAVAILVGTLGLIPGGRIGWTFLPEIEGDVVRIFVRMPKGTPEDRMAEVEQRIIDSADRTVDAFGGPSIERGNYSWIFGEQSIWVRVFLVPADERDFDAAAFSTRWRDELGEIAGAESVTFNSATGSFGSPSVTVELVHKDNQVLELAAERLGRQLETYAGVDSVDTGFETGTPQIDLRLSEAGRAAGLTPTDLGRQIRGHFFGAEAVREQRGREELRVYVRRPRSERATEAHIEDTILRAPDGAELPLRVAAEVSRGVSPTLIRRFDGFRTIRVQARVDPQVNTPSRIVADLEGGFLAGLVDGTPGLSYRLGGAQQREAETYGALEVNATLAVLAMLGLLAVVFRSFLQPLLIASAIPFGVVGALLGHLVAGYDLSLVSVLGIVALTGVVINDSLILVVAINELRQEGVPTFEAVVQGAVRRFRPILLTSLTTFFGLAPMILERSTQARFLVPMALSLGFGILAATGITLVVVPALYLLLEDARAGFRWVYRSPGGGTTPDDPEAPPAAPLPDPTPGE
ncbi:MAG TPA: efflux RND transporter permease subunit [Polyangiaceae bacterium LLY-WYZ-14_1]|nr:efflux RND transporter permease subunit [Polyangiaceae bacterium LLY-WYZ-14_1]